jgi:glutathione S-transferase
MITLHGRATAFNVQKVAWLLEELGLPYRRVDVGGEFGGLDVPAFRALNPHGKIPVIEDGDVVVWESQAILRYLAAKYGAPDFWSDDPARRAEVDQWMDWGQTTFSRDFLIGVFWGWYRTPPDRRDMAAVEAAHGRVARGIEVLETRFGDTPYLLGESPSLADIAIGTTLYRYHEIDIPRVDAPLVSAWYRRLTERPAYRAAVMVPFAYMEGRLDY